MENLTVKELQSLCKGFGLSKTGHKCELIDRIVEHLSHSNSTEINSEDVSCQNQNTYVANQWESIYHHSQIQTALYRSIVCEYEFDQS